MSCAPCTTDFRDLYDEQTREQEAADRSLARFRTRLAEMVIDTQTRVAAAVRSCRTP